MNNLMIRKLIISVILALVAPFSLVLVVGAFISDEGAATLERLLESADRGGLYLAAVIVFGISAFIAAQLMPSRRRRNRSSGTVVESDVEDGRERGMVKWFNVKKGFGFITWDDGEDVFVHFRSIRGQGHRSLTEGQRVKFHVVRGQKGPQAEDVSVVRS